jgi:hypothetical protein
MSRRCVLSLLTGCLFLVPTLARPQTDPSIPPDQAVFCRGYYALCIKALCDPATKASGNVSCSCIVENGWSMGPAACTNAGRSQTTPPPAGAQLMSTYSNYFNTCDQTLSCPSGTTWAWCYGAPCTVDAKDPSRANCTCPLRTSAAKTLGGGCYPPACSAIWSAATPAADAFANRHYYEFLTKKGVTVPPPAVACTLSPDSAAPPPPR